MADIKFINYDGRCPNLCSGTLTLQVKDKVYEFGYDKRYEPFWESGGSCGFRGGDYDNEYVIKEKWVIDSADLPEELQQYVDIITELFNENVPFGCCGGCL